MNGQGEEHDKRHFPLSSGERLKAYKLNLSPCIVFAFIIHNMGTICFLPCLNLASYTVAARENKWEHATHTS